MFKVNSIVEKSDLFRAFWHAELASDLTKGCVTVPGKMLSGQDIDRHRLSSLRRVLSSQEEYPSMVMELRDLVFNNFIGSVNGIRTSNLTAKRQGTGSSNNTEEPLQVLGPVVVADDHLNTVSHSQVEQSTTESAPDVFFDVEDIRVVLDGVSESNSTTKSPSVSTIPIRTKRTRDQVEDTPAQTGHPSTTGSQPNAKRVRAKKKQRRKDDIPEEVQKIHKDLRERGIVAEVTEDHCEVASCLRNAYLGTPLESKYLDGMWNKRKRRSYLRLMCPECRDASKH